MKEKSPLEKKPVARKPAAIESRAPGKGPQPVDALRGSPALAAQRRQLAQAFGHPGREPLQRVKGRPSQEELAKALAGCISSNKGSCCSKTIEAAVELRKLADDGDVRAVLLTWVENEGTDDVDVGNHTACLVTWNEGTFVVDTTAAQFGGEALYVAPLQSWVSTIIGLQPHKISGVQQELLSAPISDSRMSSKTSNRLYEVLHPPAKTEPVEEHKDDGKEKNKDKDKRGGKDSTAKKSRCYLTSACVEARGLPDDCHELTVLREFRDGWLSEQPGGPAMVEDYYRVALVLVDLIEASGIAPALYRRIYRVVQGCVRDIEGGRLHEALQAYTALVRSLQAGFHV